MLEKIELKNFRCFENSKITIKDLNIIVGKNNAGKSSVVEALRMISMATKKCTKTTYINAPKSLKLPLTIKGFRLPVEKLKIDLRSVIYYYKADIAKITAFFKNKTKIVVYINSEVAFATIVDKNEDIITTKRKAEMLDISSISILPQISIIKENEKRLSDATILDDMDTYLSSRHFRNEMFLFKKYYFNEFKKLAEETWPGLRVRDLDYNYSRSEYINLLIEDARFPAEIGFMGSGIQMWLQIIWFVCRSQGSETIILDEPDVYMHPDLQLKILNLVKSMFKQVIIATHSIEIISNVSPRNIITIDKKDRQMRFANHLEAVQNIVDDIGSVYNLSLIKLNSSNKCFFVEGNDIKILQTIFTIF
ncbi:putative ATP-dependent endonuclease of OLD family [Clostridium beijerinckii]|uniref:ATP-dependent nuclease n=1 Tax=Clostridium beijerinckii TaxID=1520 RepID=UPI00156DF84A|nr:ATP-binding protein [Clostridium beijerinckii]NRX08090.1 putative ATP-dependent endonuclease of OLD family [Clostridium beijerinckii]